MKVFCGYSNKYDEFLDYTKHHFSKNNLNLEFRPVSFLKIGGGKCCGYCLDGNVVVAAKNNLAGEVFVHEFSHSTQFTEKSPLWEDNNEIESSISPLVTIERIKASGVADFEEFYKILCLERDCDSRAIKFIKKFDLPIDINNYVKRCNCYYFYYHWVYLTKRWKDSSTIYIKKILDKMPTKLATHSSFRKINMDLMSLYDNEL